MYGFHSTIPEERQQSPCSPIPEAKGRGLVPDCWGRREPRRDRPEARGIRQGLQSPVPGPIHPRDPGSSHLHTVPNERLLPGLGSAV